MTPVNNLSMDVNGGAINVAKINGEDYIYLTDMAKTYGADRVIDNWLRNKNTLEFLGVWEQLNNPSFNSLEFEGIKNQAGLNRFTLSAKQWIKSVNAKGIIAKAGRYGGTYAHRDIAFEFGTWLSPEFKLLIIVEFQRLKAQEQHIIEWDSHRYLSRVNYRLHTDSIKNDLLPALNITKSKQIFVYTDEADILNKIVFGQTAAEWRQASPRLAKSGKNQRDYATIQQLVILANLENLNAHFISEGKTKEKRVQALIDAATRQYKSFIEQEEQQKKLEEKGMHDA